MNDIRIGGVLPDVYGDYRFDDRSSIETSVDEPGQYFVRLDLIEAVRNDEGIIYFHDPEAAHKFLIEHGRGGSLSQFQRHDSLRSTLLTSFALAVLKDRITRESETRWRVKVQPESRTVDTYDDAIELLATSLFVPSSLVRDALVGMEESKA